MRTRPWYCWRAAAALKNGCGWSRALHRWKMPVSAIPDRLRGHSEGWAVWEEFSDNLVLITAASSKLLKDKTILVPNPSEELMVPLQGIKEIADTATGIVHREIPEETGEDIADMRGHEGEDAWGALPEGLQPMEEPWQERRKREENRICSKEFRGFTPSSVSHWLTNGSECHVQGKQRSRGGEVSAVQLGPANRQERCFPYVLVWPFVLFVPQYPN